MHDGRAQTTPSREPSTPDRRALAWWGAGLLTLAALLGTAVAFGFSEPPGLDTWWNTLMADGRSEPLVAFAHAMNWIGGGWRAVLLVPMLVIVALLLARLWREATFVAVSFLASAAAVQALKQLFGRARPEDMLVLSDYGSFPSGHTANAATIAVVLWVLFPRVWVGLLGAAWVIAMGLSRTILSVHWATDTVGGTLVGAAVVLLVGAVMLPWVRGRSSADQASIEWKNLSES